SPAAIEVNEAQVPIARPRSAFGKLAPMSERLPGTRRAAPTPCAPRARMSIAAEEDVAHHTEAAAKRPSPAEKTDRRPRRSPRAPPTRSRADKASMYALTIH